MLRLRSIPRLLLRDARAQSKMVYPWELPSIMRKHILTGAMGTVYFVLLSGMYLVTFGNGIGMRYWQWGLLSGASSFALLLQLLSAYVVSRTGSRRSLWFVAAMAGRTLRIVAITAAFALHSRFGSRATLVFIVLLVLANAFEAIAVPPWFSWLADIIPRDEHGRFMGRRSAWIALANVWIVVPIGFAMDRLGGGSNLNLLMLLFGFGSVLGIVDLVIHRTIPDPPVKRSRKARFWREVARPLKDRRFRPWLIFNVLWTFGMTLGGSLATIYFVENLGIRRNFFGGSLVLILVPLAATAVAGKYLGTLVDRLGVKRTLR